MTVAKLADRKSRCGTSVRPPAAKALSSTWSFRKSVRLYVTCAPSIRGAALSHKQCPQATAVLVTGWEEEGVVVGEMLAEMWCHHCRHW